MLKIVLWVGSAEYLLIIETISPSIFFVEHANCRVEVHICHHVSCKKKVVCLQNYTVTLPACKYPFMFLFQAWLPLLFFLYLYNDMFHSPLTHGQMYTGEEYSYHKGRGSWSCYRTPGRNHILDLNKQKQDKIRITIMGSTSSSNELVSVCSVIINNLSHYSMNRGV